jgi:hypothetical protein
MKCELCGHTFDRVFKSLECNLDLCPDCYESVEGERPEMRTPEEMPAVEGVTIRMDSRMLRTLEKQSEIKRRSAPFVKIESQRRKCDMTISHEDQMRTLKERMKASRLCVAPDRDEPHLICGHPLPCPYHTLVMTEDEALDFLEELDQVEGDAGEDFENRRIPICANCFHKATSHAVDDEELRECMEWCCDCDQFIKEEP